LGKFLDIRHRLKCETGEVIGIDLVRRQKRKVIKKTT